MKLLTIIQWLTLSLALLLAGVGNLHAADPTNAAPPVTARDFYNAGTKLLAAKKFTEAETMFQSALAAQDERVQPQALYNLGHARFDLGLDLLKKGPDAQKVMAQGNAALAAGDRAIQQAGSALAQNDLNQMVDAYLVGRGIRRQIHDAEKAVAQAMETYSNTLHKWEQALDDFKSTAELNPADANARQNAEVVERGIAKLVDEVRQMQDMAGQLGSKKNQLGKMMSKLKGQMPGFQAPPGGPGDGDDEDTMPISLAGQKEGPSREGNEASVQISPDQAAQILDGLRLDGSRRLPMDGTQEAKPRDTKHRNW
jgi:tetratricopeptide (TPR) repeat protein